MIEIKNIRPCTLIEEGHIYRDSDGVEAIFSISEIANRGKSIDNNKYTKAASEVGTYIHKLLHNILKANAIDDKYIDFDQCIDYCKKSSILDETEKVIINKFLRNLQNLEMVRPEFTSERSMMADFNGIPVAGTADLILKEGGKVYIVDFKTSRFEGFKKEYHMQLWGYFLLGQGAFYGIEETRAYLMHIEGTKLAWETPCPGWVSDEFEENFFFLVESNKPKNMIDISKIELNKFLDLSQRLTQIKEMISNINKEAKRLIYDLEAKEKEISEELKVLAKNMMGGANYAYIGENIAIERQKTRRHTIKWHPDIEKYYTSSVEEALMITLNDSKIKLKD